MLPLPAHAYPTQEEVLGKWPGVSGLIAGVRKAHDWGAKARCWNEVGLPACLPVVFWAGVGWLAGRVEQSSCVQ